MSSCIDGSYSNLSDHDKLLTAVVDVRPVTLVGSNLFGLLLHLSVVDCLRCRVE